MYRADFGIDGLFTYYRQSIKVMISRYGVVEHDLVRLEVVGALK